MVVFLAVILLWILGGVGTLLLFKYTWLKYEVDEHLLSCIFWPIYLLVVGVKIIADFIDTLNDGLSDWIHH